MRWRLLFLVAAAGALVAGRIIQDSRPGAADAASQAAQRLLGALPPDQRSKAALPFSHPKRLDWHYVPREGTGASMKEMPDEARRAGRALLATAFGTSGRLKIESIMSLDRVLHDLDASRGRE